MLVGIEGKDLGPKFFLGIDLGGLEGQISWGLFSDSIFYPSVIGASVHSCALQLFTDFYLVTRKSPSKKKICQTALRQKYFSH